MLEEELKIFMCPSYLQNEANISPSFGPVKPVPRFLRQCHFSRWLVLSPSSLVHKRELEEGNFRLRGWMQPLVA